MGRLGFERRSSSSPIILQLRVSNRRTDEIWKYLILDLEMHGWTTKMVSERRCTHLKGKEMELKPGKARDESESVGGPSENHRNS
jgi:hypothetical protein